MLGVEIERLRVDIAEHRPSAQMGDGLDRRHIGERGGDDFVAATDSEGGEAKQQRVSPRRHANPVPYTAVPGDFLLQRLDLFAENELALA